MTERTVSDQLYEAISAAIAKEWSINRIAKGAGISQPSLQNWYSGKRSSLALETINGLCAFFGMRLTVPKIPKPPHQTGDVREPRRKPTAKGTKATPKPKRKKT